MHVRLQVQDLRSLSPEQREAEMDRLSAEEARRGFDVTQGPLLRIGLLRMKDEVSILTLTIHHLLCDGWSIGLIMEELQQIYSAFAEGKPSPLSPLAIQYADYVVWQREQLTSEGIAQQLAYWKTS